MKKHFRRIRKSKITKEEVIADSIFMLIPALISFLAIFLFDIHHSFYSWPFEMKFIFGTPYPYMIFVPIGTIAGFFLIKLFLFGVEEEKHS